MTSVRSQIDKSQPTTVKEALPAGQGVRTSHIAGLDAFRALAILSVMCLHWLPAGCLLNRLQDQISNGVHLFFVLSGFLITRILLQCRCNVERELATRAHSMRQFYARRFLRIFPLYYFALAIGLLFHFQGVRAGFVWHATYLSNVYYYTEHVKNPYDGPAFIFWSLAVEEQFYLVWPLAILLLPRRAIFPFVSIVALLGTACRVNALLLDTWMRLMTPACMNFLALGALVAVAESPWTGSVQFQRRLLQTFGVLAAILACCSAGLALKLGFHNAMQSFVMKAFNQPMMSLLYACMIGWAAGGVTGLAGPVLRFAPLVYLGRISYGLYVYHLFVSSALLRCQGWLGSHFLGAKLAAHLVNNFGIRFAATVIVASASWHLFERPLNDLKRFFPYRNAVKPIERTAVPLEIKAQNG